MNLQVKESEGINKIMSFMASRGMVSIYDRDIVEMYLKSVLRSEYNRGLNDGFELCRSSHSDDCRNCGLVR